MFKRFIQNKLESYVKVYFNKHPEVKLVVVAGSVGKTSTKIAIATVLSERYRVRLHKGNYNTNLSTPLAILGIDFPDKLRNIGMWLTVFRAIKRRIAQPTDVDVIVQELGSDRIGQIPRFGTYLHPDICVVTAVFLEHMEYFKTIDAVASEELAAANFSKLAIINYDDIDEEYNKKYLTNTNINTYGTDAMSDYHYISEGYTIQDGHSGMFTAPEWNDTVAATIHVLGEHSLRPAVAAVAVAVKLGMSATEVSNGLTKLRAIPGRMNVLRGVENTIIIDDTYNSSPLAAASALRVLYQLLVPQRIAVLGDMNELGEMSESEHEKLGKLCDPNELAWVITVGEQSEKFLAPIAKAKGCQVKSFKNALQAGIFVRSVMESGAAILFKGSEGGIYLEEAVKVVLHSTDDELQLVRQSPGWMARKTAFFQQNF